MATGMIWVSALWFLVLPSVLTIWSLCYGRKEALIAYAVLFLATSALAKSFVISVFLVWFIFVFAERMSNRDRPRNKNTYG